MSEHSVSYHLLTNDGLDEWEFVFADGDKRAGLKIMTNGVQHEARWESSPVMFQHQILNFMADAYNKTEES